MTPAQFVAQYLPFAQSASQSTGLPTDYILGQAALETGYGTSNGAMNDNNLFGISSNGSLNSYSSPQAGFDAYAGLINSSRYNGVTGVGNNPYNIASYLNNAGYSTTPTAQYATSVAGATQVIDGVLGGLQTSGNSGAAGSPASTTAPGSSVAGTVANAVVGAASKAIGSQLVRGVMIVIGLLLFIGAIVMFARSPEAQAQVRRAIVP